MKECFRNKTLRNIEIKKEKETSTDIGPTMAVSKKSSEEESRGDRAC